MSPRALLLTLLVCAALACLAAPSAQAATFTVINTNDSGAGSLRQAITDAVASANSDTIVFSIPGSGVKTIAPLTPLPTITSDTIIIDATTQPGWSAGNPVIELSGENLSGPSARGLIFVGVVQAGQSFVRGLIINRFEGSGLSFQDSKNITIEGCFIGTDSTGTLARPNTTGIDIRIFAAQTDHITVGGNTATTRNVISGNSFLGINIFGGNNFSVRGNYIGTDKTGQFAIPNTFGVQFLCSSSAIGGATAADGNVISGNSSVAVSLDSTNNTVQNNLIGIAADGISPLGNGGDGLSINNGVQLMGNHLVTGNVIAFNQGNGVNVLTSQVPPIANRIIGNSIYGNTGLSIDLNDDGDTPNDVGDADTGPNNLQNYPVLSSAVATATGTTVLGTLQSEPGVSYRIEFFSNRSNVREGRTFLGFKDVTADGTGTATINASVTGFAYSGEFVTATATRNTAPTDTSEMSATVPVIVTTLTVTNANDSGVGSLRQAILDANASADATAILFAIPPFTSTVKTINLLSALPTITGPVAINGLSQALATPAGPKIELNGTSAGASSNGLTITGDHVEVNGLVINRFGGSGIFLSTSNNSLVQNNRLGTNPGGSAVAANAADGLFLSFSNNNRVLNNLIGGNAGAGLRLTNSSSNIIQGNTIGLDARQTAALSNHGGGIVGAVGSSNNSIGGSAAGEGNVISGNGAPGVSISGTSTTGNRILGNVIGTNSAGTATTFGNSDGIALGASTSSTNIGGTTPGTGNVIASNQGAGISLASTAGSGNRILGNVIRANRDLGIDLNVDGVTANDALDTDNGPNGLQNFPVISAAEAYFAGLTVTGSLNSYANSSFRIEVFANPSCDSSGNGEGQTFVGFIEVTTNGSGNATFSETFPVLIGTGQAVTSTATRLSTGDTSEFSACRTVTALSVPTLTVINTNDSGAGSFRQALLDANTSSNPNQIVFNIPGSGVQTITPTSPFPVVTGAVVIDGLTQPGATAAVPLIELNGQSAGTSANGLQISGSGIIQGLIINRFNLHGLLFDTLGHNIVKSCRIGLDATGILPRGNGRCGIMLNQVSDNTIGGGNSDGNLVSCNNVLSTGSGGSALDSGIRGVSSSNNIVQGNTVGPNLAGNATTTGMRIGISFSNGSGNLIGGASVGARNVINCCSTGMYLQNSASNIVQGNYLGLNAAGALGTGLANFTAGLNIENAPNNQVLGNVISNTRQSGVGFGIAVSGTSTQNTVITGNLIGTNAAGTADAGNLTGIRISAGAGAVIGGQAAGLRNIISGNDTAGLQITNQNFTSAPPVVRAAGNYIGLGADGTSVLANGIGVLIEQGADGNVIGGGAANIISGNTTGIALDAAGTLVQGNRIGTDAAGALAKANGTGIQLRAGATGGSIGGDSVSARNLISGNGVALATATGASTAGGNLIQFNLLGTALDGSSPLPNTTGLRLESSTNTISDNTIAFHNSAGVVIVGTGSANRISRNAIFSNTGIGIDLGDDGATANDAGDADAGANLRQNFPVLTEAAFTVKGTFNSIASAIFTLQFFLNPTGGGQGKIFLGEQSVTTNASGNATFNFVPTTVVVPLPAGQTVTATATDASGNTSEFSAAVTVHQTYEGWAAANGIPGELRGDDFDHDGIPNVVEYALGLNPTVSNVVPTLIAAGANEQLTIPKGSEAAGDPAILYRFQTSADLQIWSALQVPTTENSTQAVFALPVGSGKQFLRFVAVSQ